MSNSTLRASIGWRQWSLFGLLLLMAAALLWSRPQHAKADLPPGSGFGLYSLDKSSYSTLEGQAVTVGINVTGAGTLSADVAVTLQLTPPTVDGNGNPLYPISTVTQTFTFKAGTVPTFGTLQFQTLNYNRIVDTNIGVNIISVTGGGGLNTAQPTFATIDIMGLGTPRVTNVEPHSAKAGDTLIVTGQNFAATNGTCPATPQPPTLPFVRCVLAVKFSLVGNPAVSQTFTAFTVLGPTLLTMPAPALTNLGVPYDLSVVVEDPTGTAPNYTALSPIVAGDQFTTTGNTSPTITAMSTHSGQITGGGLLTVTGTNFGGCPTALAFQGLPGQGFATVFADVTTCPPGSASATQFSIRIPPTATAHDTRVVATFGSGATVPTNDSAFSYVGSPVITSISPQFGPAIGGTTVTIRGTSFVGIICPTWTGTGTPPASTAVRFGATPALSCNLAAPFDGTIITAVAPPGTGTQQITVTSQFTALSTGTSGFTTAANYTYSAGPVIASIAPSSGPPGGGTSVTITGSGFAAGATVNFGSVSAPFVTVVSPNQITTTSPAGAGAVHVTVTIGGVSSPSVAGDVFSYSSPVVTSVLPNAGPLAGGTAVQINGSNFTSDAVVFFGTTQVPTTFVSPILLQAVSPPSNTTAASIVDVIVQSSAGTSATSSADSFNYTNGPIIASLNPATGGTSGGIPVVITGTNFIAGATVMFGGTPATAVNVNSATQITALSPSVGTAGVVDVRVTTTAGVTPISSLDEFTYTSSVPVVTGVSPASGLVSGGLAVTITGTGFTGALCSGIVFGTIQAPACTVVNDTSITAVTPPNAAGPSYLTVTTPNGTSAIVQNFTYLPLSAGSGGNTGGPPAGSGGSVQLPPPTGAPVTYTLNFQWTLIIWRGADGVSVGDALKGPTGDITSKVSAIYAWDPVHAAWLGYFTGYGGLPGVTSLTTLSRGGVYWIALAQPGSVTLAGTDG